MNESDYKAVIQQVKDGFQRNKGKGFCYLYSPVNVAIVLFDVLISLINKRPEIKILIITELYSQKVDITEAFKHTQRDEYLLNIKFLTHAYALNVKPNLYDVIIFVGIHDDAELIKRCANAVRFSLIIFTRAILDNTFKNEVASVLTQIPVQIDKERINNSRIYSPVEEYRHDAILSEEDLDLSKKYDAYIKDSINIFGSLKMIEYCRNGNPATHQSAMDCKYQVAYHNGWSTDMDKSIDFNRQIDELYNPNALGERVNTIFQITNLRKKLIANNIAKLPIIKSIIDKDPHKKYLIVSLTGEFCNAIVKYLVELGYAATGCHNELEDSYLSDANGIICYKSGELKGQPKVFKAAALSSNNLLGYNKDYYNILCIKSSAKPDIELKADVLIFTTPLIDTIFEFRQRFENIQLPVPTIIHRIYCKSTNEESTILKEAPSSFVRLHDFTEELNIQIDESGNIVL